MTLDPVLFQPPSNSLVLRSTLEAVDHIEVVSRPIQVSVQLAGAICSLAPSTTYAQGLYGHISGSIGAVRDLLCLFRMAQLIESTGKTDSPYVELEQASLVIGGVAGGMGPALWLDSMGFCELGPAADYLSKTQTVLGLADRSLGLSGAICRYVEVDNKERALKNLRGAVAQLNEGAQAILKEKENAIWNLALRILDVIAAIFWVIGSFLFPTILMPVGAGIDLLSASLGTYRAYADGSPSFDPEALYSAASLENASFEQMHGEIVIPA